ncbi:hypothetical protein G9A89_020988 [Geosiphon pyriformis]|nr:hypothetical protein G9A89_020988 [Geosiphon pyriformis]
MQYPELYNIQKASITFKKRDQKPLVTFGALPRKQHSKNKFKVVITPDATTLEYYQSIYTHCKQRFNISDGIEVVKKSVYQYIKNHINNYLFGNYNISEVRSNLYNNLAHYSQLGTEDLNSETLATYFQELNFNIIKYCEETYSVQSQYSINFELETKTSNKGKHKLKQYSITTPNTSILPKTTAKHLQTPEQETTENQSKHSETAANEENNSEITEEESIDSKNKEDEMTAYIAKIPEFNGKDIETSPQEWLNQVTKAGDANRWNAVRILRTISYFLKGTAGECLKNKLIKKIRPHVPEDLNSAIQHAKRYEMTMEKTNRTKLVNLAIGKTSSAVEEKIDQLTKKPIPQPIQQQYQQPPTQYYQVLARRLITQNQFTSQNRYQINNNRISLNNQLVPQNSTQPRSNHYHIQPSYLTMPEEQNFHPTAPSEARIAENANLSDIFSFEFEANESPFLLNNIATNEQKAITAMYTEAEVKGKTICLILNSGSAGSIITYQLMQQLKRNVDQPAQTVIITADGMKKTSVREIDNFLFTLDGITIPVKVLVMDMPQYQALVGNNWLQKANAKLDWETQELQLSYQGQHTQVPATCGTFNKCSEKVPAFEFEPEEEKPIIETFMALGSTSNWADKTEQQSKKWDNTPCLTCGDMLLEEYNWIDIAIRERVCNQTCQYALSISEKVKRGTPFNAVYNNALNKLYHYPYDAEMIFDLAMTLINRATKEDVHQIKEAEYIEYTIELTGFDYEDKVEVYHQIASHTYSTQEAQIQ